MLECKVVGERMCVCVSMCELERLLPSEKDLTGK